MFPVVFVIFSFFHYFFFFLKEALLRVCLCAGKRERALPRGFQLSHCLNIPYF